MVNKVFIIFFFLILQTLPSFSQMDKGLIATYYFSGNANDSVSHINGVVRGATLTRDRFGNAYSAYSFDGNNDYITLGTNSDLKQEKMSISVWVKIDDFKNSRLNYPGTPFIITKVRHSVQRYEAYAIAMLENNKFCGGSTSSLEQQVTTNSSVIAEHGKWYHLVYMFDTDTTYLYVNGNFQQKNFKGFVTNYAITDSVILGYTGNNMPEAFKYRNYSWLNGCLDDIKFYNRLLSEEDVKSLYNEPDPKLAGKPNPSETPNYLALLDRFWYIPVSLLIIIIVTIIVIRWRINYFRQKEKANNELQQKFAQMEMKALRSQMNPHFIFNAINSIQHYVLTNEKELANKYLVKFSQLMRNILDLSKQELISLKDELETVKLYLDIESLRFNNAFSFSVDVSPEISLNDIRLPPLLIQPFVENAIWHGLLLKEGNKKLTIAVFKKESNLIIEIDDNGIGREASQKFSSKELKRRSFGMDITQDRLSILDKVFGISISFLVIDKMDDKNVSSGTKVLINIKL